MDYNANRESSKQNTKKRKIEEVSDTSEEERPRKIARWSVLEKAYKIDQMSNGFELQMKKLTDKHIYLENRTKMRVKQAVQVLSNTVANYIESLAGKGNRFLSLSKKIVRNTHQNLPSHIINRLDCPLWG